MYHDLRDKRNNYINNLIRKHLEESSESSMFECYEFVKREFTYSQSPFFQELTKDEIIQYSKRPEKWQIPLESVETFRIYLTNESLIEQFD